MKEKLLIVEDAEEIQAQLRWALATEYDIAAATDRASALESFKTAHPLVGLIDLGLPPSPTTPEEGLATLADLLAIDPLTKLVVVSGQSERNVARQAVGAGAYDFVTKPVNMEELKLVLRRCYHVAHLEREYREIRTRFERDTFEGMLGTCPAMQLVFEAIRKVATTDAPVLIRGESGTGKELTARAIHQRSTRHAGPFIALNCSAIPETLIESELFGHEKGSFTGAHVQRKGRIESAAGGTLFLDEIGEISPAVQVKLLRFLQEQTVERIGGRQTLTVDARIVAATNVNLHQELGVGKFRDDLFYRLAVVQITLPPLRDRGDDIVLLAHAFLHQFAAPNHRRGLTFSDEALRTLRRYEWPGNVRELQNRIRRAVIMGDGRRISSADLEISASLPSGATDLGSLREARDRVEREMVQQALLRHRGKITAAAAELGISRPTLYELIARLGVERPS